MRKAFLVPVLLFILANPAFAQNREYTVSFTGEAVMSVVPDVGIINFQVESVAAKAQLAMSAQAYKMQQILDFLESKNIEDKNITTQSYSFLPQYEEQGDGRGNYKKVFIGYKVAQNVNVEVPKNSVGEVIDGIADNAFIASVRFEVSNMRELRKALVYNAIKDAETKARQKAKYLGITLGKIVGFQENTTRYAPVVRQMESAMIAGDVKPQLPAGESEISTSVTVTYLIVL